MDDDGKRFGGFNVKQLKEIKRCRGSLSGSIKTHSTVSLFQT